MTASYSATWGSFLRVIAKAALLFGLFNIVFAAIMLVKAQFMLALPAVIGGAVLLKADAIVTSLGAII